MGKLSAVNQISDLSHLLLSCLVSSDPINVSSMHIFATTVQVCNTFGIMIDNCGACFNPERFSMTWTADQ